MGYSERMVLQMVSPLPLDMQTSLYVLWQDHSLPKCDEHARGISGKAHSNYASSSRNAFLLNVSIRSENETVSKVYRVKKIVFN